MDTSGLILFGKHPAWSDHMLVTTGAGSSHLLKPIFYDHSVIPALQQGGEVAESVLEGWSFLVFLDSQVYCIVSVPSSDAVGRTRFPLMVACPLPTGLCLEAACAALASLKQELRALLHAVLVFPEDDDSGRWQADVSLQVESFRSAVDWASGDSSGQSCEISRPILGSLMTRLLDEHDVLNLQSCSYAEACVLVQVGLKQFKTLIPVMLVLDQADHGDAVLFAFNREAGFRIQRYLHGNLPSLSVKEANLSAQVIRLLGPSSVELEHSWALEDVPSLRLDVQAGDHPTLNLSRKHLYIAVVATLILSILIGLLFGGGGDGDDDDSAPSEVDTGQSFPARDAWISNATAYVEWVQQFAEYVDRHPSRIPSQDPVMRALQLELNPFSVVNGGEIRADFVKNPSNRIFRTSNIDKLDRVYANIRQLRDSLTFYYEQNFTNQLSADLAQRGYQLPSYIAVDFSIKPIQPYFGTGLLPQFAACIQGHEALEELVESSKALEHAIIQPLGQLFPEHAELVQQYLQKIIAESESLEVFQRQYAELSEVLFYPDLIQPDALNVEALSIDVEWQGILQQETQLQSIRKLVNLLGAYQLIGADKYEDLQSNVEQSIEQTLEMLQQVLSDFPNAALDSDAMQQQLNQFASGIDRTCKPTQGNFI